MKKIVLMFLIIIASLTGCSASQDFLRSSVETDEDSQESLIDIVVREEKEKAKKTELDAFLESSHIVCREKIIENGKTIIVSQKISEEGVVSLLLDTFTPKGVKISGVVLDNNKIRLPQKYVAKVEIFSARMAIIVWSRTTTGGGYMGVKFSQYDIIDGVVFLETKSQQRWEEIKQGHHTCL